MALERKAERSRNNESVYHTCFHVCVSDTELNDAKLQSVGVLVRVLNAINTEFSPNVNRNVTSAVVPSLSLNHYHNVSHRRLRRDVTMPLNRKQGRGEQGVDRPRI